MNNMLHANRLRDRILRWPGTYTAISQEAGLGREGESYVRKFATGVIVDVTSARYFALVRAMDRLERRHARTA
jgi:hypothetical protein